MNELGLVRYNSMCKAIDCAYEVDEVKSIRDKAMALEAYARQAKNVEAERRLIEIRLRAERKAGELLRKMQNGKSPGRFPMISRGRKSLKSEFSCSFV